MRKPNHINVLLTALIFFPQLGHAASGDEINSTPVDQKEISISIYNNNLALIKDTRRIKLARESNLLAWRGVSAQMRPETAQLRSLNSATGLRLLEQHFDFDLLGPERLLEKYLGKEVFIIRTHPTTGVETREAATVLSTQGGVVLKFADRIETGVPGRLAFASLPDRLRDTPTLVMSLLNSHANEHHLELTYLTGGLSWQADYVAELNARDDRLNLNGWATLTNQSGAAYPNAKLQLIAGDVNVVSSPQAPQRGDIAMVKMAEVAQMRTEPAFEYHVYTLPRTITLAENQTKQVALMSAANVPVNKEYVLQGASYYYSGPYPEIGQKIKVGVFIELQNKGEGLGDPLPKGVIRVYKKDAQGNAQFVGEDRMDHTPKNETIRLKLGDAFDITADKKQTDFQKLATVGRNTTIETAYQIVLNNAKKEAVTVIVREPIPGDWTMVSESTPHRKAASNVAEWKVRIPAEGSATLNYRVRVKY